LPPGKDDDPRPRRGEEEDDGDDDDDDDDDDGRDGTVMVMGTGPRRWKQIDGVCVRTFSRRESRKVSRVIAPSYLYVLIGAAVGHNRVRVGQGKGPNDALVLYVVEFHFGKTVERGVPRCNGTQNAGHSSSVPTESVKLRWDGPAPDLEDPQQENSSPWGDGGYGNLLGDSVRRRSVISLGASHLEVQ
jgi:hypothetical protein